MRERVLTLILAAHSRPCLLIEVLRSRLRANPATEQWFRQMAGFSPGCSKLGHACCNCSGPQRVNLAQ